MPVSYAEDAETRTVLLTVDGRVTQDDWDRIVPRFEAFMNAHGTIRLVEIIESLKGFDPVLLWDGVRFDMKAIPHISHCAIATDIGWMSPIVKAAGKVMSMQMRVFPLAESDAAREWATNAP